MNKKKGTAADRAVPTIRQVRNTDATKVSVTRSTTTAMKGSPQWAGAPALQAAVTSWNAASDAIDANAKAIKDLRAQLAVLVAAQLGHRRDWDVATKQVISQAEITSVGERGKPQKYELPGRRSPRPGWLMLEPQPAGLSSSSFLFFLERRALAESSASRAR